MVTQFMANHPLFCNIPQQAIPSILEQLNCRTENFKPAGVFSFAQEEKEESDCRCVGMHGGARQGRFDYESPCRLGGRSGCLSHFARFDSCRRGRGESH